MASKPDLPDDKTDEGDQFIQVPRKRRQQRRPQPTGNDPEATEKAPEQKAEEKPKKVYGKPGDIYCLLCRAMRDHSAFQDVHRTDATTVAKRAILQKVAPQNIVDSAMYRVTYWRHAVPAAPSMQPKERDQTPLVPILLFIQKQ